MTCEIEGDEQVAGEKRRLERGQPARVSNGLVAFRLKRAKSLTAELSFCARFGKRQRVHRIPPLAIRPTACEGCRGVILQGRARFAIDMVLPAYSASVNLRADGGRISR
jgi:hypothetical protein